jgi:hypothetical protein
MSYCPALLRLSTREQQSPSYIFFERFLHSVPLAIYKYFLKFHSHSIICTHAARLSRFCQEPVSGQYIFHSKPGIPELHGSPFFPSRCKMYLALCSYPAKHNDISLLRDRMASLRGARSSRYVRVLLCRCAPEASPFGRSSRLMLLCIEAGDE